MAKRGRKKAEVSPLDEFKIIQKWLLSLGVKSLYGIKPEGSLHRMVKVIPEPLQTTVSVEDLRAIQIGKIVFELEGEAQ